MSILVTLMAFLNSIVNAFASILFDPLVGSTPGWVSNLIISAAVGIWALVIYKYTSNQDALGKVWDSIKGHLLGLILFKDNIAVTMKLQGKLFMNSAMLLWHSLKPMAFMIIPISLVLAQLGQWYQARPLLPGEECLVSVSTDEEGMSEINMEAIQGAEVTAGPVMLPDQNQICWKIKALDEGTQDITFKVGSEEVSKSLVVGQGLKKLGFAKANSFGAVFMNPSEKPLPGRSIIKSISIDYPDRPSKAAGTDWWLGYFFVVSLIAALILKPALKVN